LSTAGTVCFWKLKDRIVLGTLVDGKFSSEDEARIDDVEARIEEVMLRLGSKAGTQNIDRILRLPGTTNLPNKKKLSAGRLACPTRLIRFSDATHTLDAFPAPASSDQRRNAGSGVGPDIDALPISKRIKDLIRGIDDPKHLYASRSEAVFAVIVAMVGGGCADGQIEAVFLDAGHPISAHVLEQAKPPVYLARQIAKAHKVNIDPHVAKLNEHYALVIVGDKTAILKTTDDGIKFLTRQAFHEWYANRHVHRDGKKVPLARHWMQHPQRRQYQGVEFSAGTRFAELLQPVAWLCRQTESGGLLEISGAPERQCLPRRRRSVRLGGRMVCQHHSTPRKKAGYLTSAARQDGHRQNQGWRSHRVAAGHALRAGIRSTLRHRAVQFTPPVLPAAAL
jgi:hypothetical protein